MNDLHNLVTLTGANWTVFSGWMQYRDTIETGVFVELFQVWQGAVLTKVVNQSLARAFGRCTNQLHRVLWSQFVAYRFLFEYFIRSGVRRHLVLFPIIIICARGTLSSFCVVPRHHHVVRESLSSFCVIPHHHYHCTVAPWHQIFWHCDIRALLILWHHCRH